MERFRPNPYLKPAASVLGLEPEHAVLDDSDHNGTEPIVDDGSSHGWG